MKRHTLSSYKPESFWEHGFMIIKNVFTLAEVEQFRQESESVRLHKGDLLSAGPIGRFLYDERTLSIAAKILGTKPFYFGDSCASFGDTGFHFHKDNTDRTDEKGPDWKGNYPLIRFGLYLQDHAYHAGGIVVRAKSHNIPNTYLGKMVYLGTEPGDLAIWNLRTTHAGNGYLLKFPRKLTLERNRALKLPRFCFRGSEKERIALFATYGAPGVHLERYLTYLKTRTYMVDMWKNSSYNEQTWQAIRDKNITVKEVWPQIKEEANLGLDVEYRPFPF